MRRGLLCLLGLIPACGAPEAAREGAGDQPTAAETCATPLADWGFEKLGAVRGLPDADAAGDGALAPSAVEHEGQLHVWYTRKEGSRHVIAHAISADGGESFGPPTEVVGLGEDRSAYPSVWRRDGKFELLFGSGSIRRATSDDGITFTTSPAPVLGASFAAGRFDALSVVYPSRVATETGEVVFFSGYDGQRLRIGRAAARRDGTFEVDPPRPVLDLGADGAFDGTAVAQPHVQRAFDKWWMWYGGYDTSLTNPGPYRIGLASSVDGVRWDKHGVAVPLGVDGTDAWSTRDAALVVHRGRWLMLYVGLGSDGRYRLHRAVSDVCVPAAG